MFSPVGSGCRYVFFGRFSNIPLYMNRNLYLNVRTFAPSTGVQLYFQLSDDFQQGFLHYNALTCLSLRRMSLAQSPFNFGGFRWRCRRCPSFCGQSPAPFFSGFIAVSFTIQSDDFSGETFSESFVLPLCFSPPRKLGNATPGGTTPGRQGRGISTAGNRAQAGGRPPSDPDQRRF